MRQEHVGCSSGRARRRQRPKCKTGTTRDPLSLDGAQILTHVLVAEPYSSGAMRPGAVKAVLHIVSRVPCRDGLPGRHGDVTIRGHETHRNDYTRPPASLGNELGGLSTSLGLFASPPLILATESVVVMECKGMSTAIATWAALPVDLSRCKPKARNRHCSGP